MRKEQKTQGKPKAVILFSGGLDSALSFKLLENNFNISGVIFTTPFSKARPEAFKLAARLGLPLKEIVIREEYFKIMLKPKFGFGSGANPCLDCHIMMLKKASEYAGTLGAEYIITGEVMSQRMKSQKKDDLSRAEAETGLEGRIIRPLSAKLLAGTLAESRGIIDRKALCDISGKSRRKQLALAEKYGLEGYSTPAGGCLLTDPGFSRRVKDALSHGELSMPVGRMLRYGRHFRLKSGAKLIVPRNEKEDKFLSAEGVKYTMLVPQDAPGPSAVLLSGGAEAIAEAAAVLAHYAHRASRFSIVSVGEVKGEISPAAVSGEEITGIII